MKDARSRFDQKYINLFFHRYLYQSSSIAVRSGRPSKGILIVLHFYKRDVEEFEPLPGEIISI